MNFVRFLLLLTLILSPSAIRAADDGKESTGWRDPRDPGNWPDGLVLVYGSASPDGRYGILAHRYGHPPYDLPGPFSDPDQDNRLADLKEHRILIEHIAGAQYSVSCPPLIGWIDVAWAKDSSLCLVHYSIKGDNGSAIALRPADCSERDLQKEVAAAASTLVAGNSDITWNTDIAGAQLRLYAEVIPFGSDKRKEKGRLAVAAVFDLNEGSWTQMKVARVPLTLSATLTSSSVNTYEDKLNMVYQNLKVFLPAGTFAKLRDEQREWLKAHASALRDPYDPEVKKRLEELKKMLWTL